MKRAILVVTTLALLLGGVGQAKGDYITTSDTGASGSILSYTVTTTGYYTITAGGAQGGSTATNIGGDGAVVSGEFYLTQGTVLQIAVGQMGLAGGANSAGGGGGTFVVVQGTDPPMVLLVAGGGGGAGPSQDGSGGTLSNSGTSGGTAPPALISSGAGGAGFDGNGQNAVGFSEGPGGVNGTGGSDWANLLLGGSYSSSTSATNPEGGFGGGGAGSNLGDGGGGGGGYSGGNGSLGGGGGGGSFDAGTNPTGLDGANSGNGFVDIEPLGVVATPEPSSLVMLGTAAASFAGYFGWRRKRN